MVLTRDPQKRVEFSEQELLDMVSEERGQVWYGKSMQYDTALFGVLCAVCCVLCRGEMCCAGFALCCVLCCVVERQTVD